jgi:hypothetical protein
MKNLITFILVLSLFICGKKEKKPIDNDYFLIGTLSDYMGREKYEKVEGRVDKYSQSEKRLCLTIDSIFKISYPDLKISSWVNKTSKKKVFELHSKALAKRIDSFYSYKPSVRMVYNGQEKFENLNLDSLTKTKDFTSTNFDTIYIGSLKKNVFKTGKQKVSFITGAYVRYGWHTDSLYHIRVFNSVSKVRILNDLLKEVNCTNVDYEIKKGYIPAASTVSFIPTEQLHDYFEKFIKFK